MKKTSIILLFILIIFSYHNVIFASYNSEVFEEELYFQIEQIFKERTRIWNQFLKGKYLNIDELEEELKIIVMNPLLKSDMEMFEYMILNPTSYEGISNISIKDIYIVKNNFRRVVLEILVLWDIEGYEYDYCEEVKYIVEIEKIKENWLLSKYEITQ